MLSGVKDVLNLLKTGHFWLKQNKKYIFYLFFYFFILKLIIISSDFREGNTSLIYRPDGHTCPDVEGPLIRSKKKKKKKNIYIFLGPNFFLKQTVR